MNLHIRPATINEFEFAFAAKKDAMGPHISVRWGWDNDFQLSIHRQRWEEKPWFIVMLDEERVGTVSLLNEPETLRFGEFYILSRHRGKGLGTKILRQVLDSCDELNQKARLEYLK